MPPEKLEGEILGFRIWELDKHRLTSAVTVHGGWEIGQNTAQCKRNAMFGAFLSSGIPHESAPVHDAPTPDCGCGLYALHNPPPPGRYGGLLGVASGTVYGAVTAWGRIQVHADGFRAQHARPVVLAYSKDQSYDHVCKLQAMAQEFEIECVELGELEEAARKYGDPVPNDLRPELSPNDAFLRYGPPVLSIGGQVVPGALGIAAPPPPDPHAVWLCCKIQDWSFRNVYLFVATATYTFASIAFGWDWASYSAGIGGLALLFSSWKVWRYNKRLEAWEARDRDED